MGAALSLVSCHSLRGIVTASMFAAFHHAVPATMTRCLTRLCTSVIARPVLRSYHWRLRSSVTKPSWTIRLVERPLRTDFATFLLPLAHRGFFVPAHDDAGVGAVDGGGPGVRAPGRLPLRLTNLLRFR
jgi:hypothetical protein